MDIKNQLKSHHRIYRIIYGALKSRHTVFRKIALLKKFFADFSRYKKAEQNENFELDIGNLSPQIYDNTTTTPVNLGYFYQDSWCAQKIFENKPKHHVDVGSKLELVGIISQFTPTTMVDIRPVDLELENLRFIKGDILSLPFKNNSLESLSSICVVEHIGLGRYGDEIDPFGSEKAAKELKRVLATNGSLYVSVPVDGKNKIYFNAHRSFTRDYILKLFKPLRLMEEKYVYGKNICKEYNGTKDLGIGLFHFKKDA